MPQIDKFGNGPQGQSPIGVHSQQTIVPGMKTGGLVPAGDRQDGKPVMGVFFSVSKTSQGEFWLLRMGPNTIGRGRANAVVLEEASVSEQHATLVVRKMQDRGEEKGVLVYIQDNGSTYGTQLNGETLDFNPREVHNGDIITVGANYELYFVLFDAASLHLAPKPEFKSSALSQAIPFARQTGFFTGGQPKGTMPGTNPPAGGHTSSTLYMQPDDNR